MPNPHDRISVMAAKARSLGLSYGQYVARFHPTLTECAPRVAAPMYTKTCPECGQVFRAYSDKKVYCSESCYNRINNRRHYYKRKGEE